MADDAAKEFQTYLFFLRHFTQLVLEGRAAMYGAPLIEQLLQAQAPLIVALQPMALNAEELLIVRKYLFTSWNSESLARLSSVFDPGVRRFTNQWKPIQCYYATYFQLVSLQYVVTRKIQRNHEPTIRYATNSIVHWLPRPWRCRLDYDSGVLIDFPPRTGMHGDSGWNLRNNEPNFHTACFLRRTAYRKQSELLQDLRRRRRRIPAGQPRAGRLYRRGDVRIGTVSVFDVLWRFRTWANYHEGDTVIEGGEYQDHAVEFDARFNELADTTATLCENVLVRYLGAAQMAPIYDGFLALTEPHLETESIGRRRQLLCP